LIDIQEVLSHKIAPTLGIPVSLLLTQAQALYLTLFKNVPQVSSKFKQAVFHTDTHADGFQRWANGFVR